MMRLFKLAIMVVLFAGTFATPSLAVLPDEVLDDPALEERARDISAELRCLVCQNQSIDDSDADLARDLRLLVRERLLEGDSNQDVFDYVVARYGEFVLLKPAMSAQNILLWAAAPLVLLLGLVGVVMAWVGAKRAQNEAQELGPLAKLTPQEREALSRIDKSNGSDS